MNLTKAQRRYLEEINDAGVKAYNGRSQKVVKALEDAGLVEWDLDFQPHANGTYTARVTAWLTEAGQAYMEKEEAQ